MSIYFDEVLLRIIFQVDENDKELFDKVVQRYEDAMDQIASDVLDLYFKSDVPKPKIKGLMDLKDINFDDPNLTEEQKELVILNAMTAASVTPEYQNMVKIAVEEFHTTMIKEQMKKLSPEEKQFFKNHLNKVKQTVMSNAKIINDIMGREEEKKDDNSLSQNQ